MFTKENTEGFNDRDLALLNAALETLMAHNPGMDESNACDIVNNNWRESDNTVESLIAR